MAQPTTEDFRQLMHKFLSDDNNERAVAEVEYGKLSTPVKFQLFIQLLKERTDTAEVLHLAAVLLRRFIFTSYDEIQQMATADQVQQIKAEMLLMLTMPGDETLRLKVSDAVSELAKQFLDEAGNNTWPELVNFIFECIKSEEAQAKEIGLNLLTNCPSIFGNQLPNYLEVLKQMFLHCMTESPQTTSEVRVYALRAIVSFILAHCDEKAVLNAMNGTLLPMIQNIYVAINSEDEHCEDILHSFQELAEKCPIFLRPQFDPLVQLCIKISTDENTEETIRHLALEIIISMAESAPSTVRKRGKQYLPQIVGNLLTMMTDLEDNLEEWTQNDTLDDEDSESNVVIGESSLDRLACAIGGKIILPLVLTHISTLLGDRENWKRRYAGLMALSTIGEACQTQIMPMLRDITNAIFPFLEDPNPRVRFAACNALGQMSHDFAPEFQERFHNTFVPAMVNLFSSSENPRVQAHSGAALTNFLEECSSKLVIQHMALVAERVEQVLRAKMQELAENNRKLVLEQAIVTLASLADSSQENFLPFYDRFIPILKYIIQNANSEDLRLLRGKTIECVSLIGLAVGKEKFCSDAADVMNMLLKTQTGEIQLADDDPQLSYIISSWARICKILGPDFEQYLPYVMGPVLKAADLKVEVTMLDKEEANELQDDDEWQCLELGDQSLGLRTAGLDEKATACHMLVCYAKELKHAFADYVEQTAKVMVPMLKFYFHEGVRTAAAECLPHLLISAKARGDEFVANLWAYIWPELVSAFETEPERDVLAELMNSLSECIEAVGAPMLTPDRLSEIRKLLSQYLDDHFERAKERLERRKDEDYDEGVEETLEDDNEVDYYLLNKVSDVLHSLFVVLRHQLLPFIDELLPQLSRLATPESPYTDSQWAVCVMDDLIEYCGEHCAKYREFFLPLFYSGIQSPHSEIRQACAYGWGVLAMHGGNSFAEDCSKSIPLMVQIIQASDSRGDENIGATENAISAITKIMQHNGSMVNVNELIPVWLSWLPIWSDESELIHVYSFMLCILESQSQLILGENNSNMPQVLSIIAEVYARNAIELNSELDTKFKMFLNLIKVNTEFLNQCFEKMSPQHVSVIHKLCSA